MTMETGIKTKVCSCCGVEKPVTEFSRHGNSKDGYTNVCNSCRAKRISETGAKSKIVPIYHEELSKLPPRMLMEHLSAIGYKGSLQIPHSISL